MVDHQLAEEHMVDHQLAEEHMVDQQLAEEHMVEERVVDYSRLLVVNLAYHLVESMVDHIYQIDLNHTDFHHQ
jgi:hypothetical protein